jgi:hypothetical protein
VKPSFSNVFKKHNGTGRERWGDEGKSLKRDDEQRNIDEPMKRRTA